MIEERGNGLFLNSKYWSYLAQVGIVAVIYFGIAKLSLALTGHPSPVWPPAGFALAVILLFGYRLWPGIAMGMFMEVILEGLPVPIAFATAAGSAGAALAGAYLFNRLGFRNSMERSWDVLGLVVLGSTVSTTISATSGAASFYLSGIIPWAASGSFWRTWWLGDMLGVIVVAPAFLAWSIRPRFDLKPKRIPEALALLALLALVSDFVFSRPVAYFGYEYMIFPFLIWAALRFGQKGATTAIIIVSGIAIWHTSQGHGSFLVGTPAQNLIFLQVFTSVVALTIMILAAIMTERNLIEDTLKKEKTFTEDALNLLEDVFFVFDLNGRFLRWNNALSAITGYSDEEISKKKHADFFLGEDIRNISNAIEMVMKNGTAKVEADLVTKNGEHINYEFNGTLLKDSKGKPLGICGAGRNITELKGAALEYKAILQTAMDGFYRVDTQGRILDVNDSYCSLIGYSREELLNMSLKDIDVLDTEEDIAQRIKRVMENGLDRFETRHKCKDGRIVEIEASVNYDKAGGGKFFAFMRDITKSRQIEDKIKQHEVHLKDMLDLRRLGNSTENEVLDFTLEASLRSLQSEFAFVGIMSADEAVMTVRKSSNGAMKRGTIMDEPLVFSIAKSGLLGEAVRQRGPIIVNDYKTSQLFKKGYPEGHAPIKRFLSLPVFSGNRIVAIAAAANKVSEYTESDVTYFTAFLNEMWGILDYQGTREEIRKSLEEKEVLLREIHHRVKNNMQIVSSLLRLQSQNIDDIKYKDILVECQTRIYSMALIHEKLYQSKGFAQINLKEYIDGLVSNIIESFGQKSNIKFDIDVEKILIQIDYAVPCGLLINELVTNSFKYAFPDGRLGIIKISAKLNNNGFIQLSISDDGIGIPKDMDIRNTKSLGLKLITGLTESQLHGEVILNRDSGTEFQINFRQAK